MKLILETQNLTKKFGKRWAVKKLNLKVYGGDIFGFLGPNGAGKSTTIRMITGLINPSTGKIFIKNELFNNVNNINLRKKIRALIETPRFYEYLTAVDNLKIIAQISGITKASEIEDSLKKVGLFSRRYDKVSSYSQGMKQRLGIAQAIMGNPEIVILDEPTNGLDPRGINEIRELIHKLNQEGVTFFISSHILKEIEVLCNRVAILNEGNLIIQGSVKNLLNSSYQTYLLKSYPIEKAIKLLTNLPGILEIEKRDKTILIKTKDLKSEDINWYLMNNGIKISLLNPASKTLEELFLELTKKKERLA